jgi:hypothetical protein
MSAREVEVIEAEEVRAVEQESGTDLVRQLMETGAIKAPQMVPQVSIVVGKLIGITNEGRTPLVLYPGQPGTAAVFARSVVGLHGSHIGHEVILTFEAGDLAKPIIMGVLRDGEDRPLAERPGQVEVDADGERLIITAKEQLILRCGKASITLTNAGKVLINGSYVVSRSTGVNRVKGGSVQIN